MMRRANSNSLTFDKVGFRQIEPMIESIFPDSGITKRKDDLFFRASVLRSPVGFIHLGKRKGIWTVIGLGVVKESREMGYGTEILKFGVDAVRGMMSHAIALSADEDNFRAMEMYSKMGFRKISRKGGKARMILVINN